MTTGNKPANSDAFRFFGFYETDVTEGKCAFPESWAPAKQLSLKWARIHECGEQWYVLVPASKMNAVPGGRGEEQLETADPAVPGVKEVSVREEIGDAVFEDDCLILPDDLKDSVVLEGCIHWIEVKTSKAHMAGNDDADTAITQILNSIDAEQH